VRASKLLVPTLFVGLLGIGCGEANLSTENPLGPVVPATAASSQADGVAAVELKDDVIAEIKVQDQTYTFLSIASDSETTVMLRIRGSVDRGNLLDAIRARDGELTMLETFQALAPDRAPPAALRDSHEREARILERSSTQVRLVDKTLPPAGVDPCDSSLFFFSPLTWLNQKSAASFWDAYICVTNGSQMGRGVPNSSSCTYFTTRRMMAGICVGPGEPSVTNYTVYGSQGGSWNATSSITVPGGEYARWDWGASTNAKRMGTVGLVGGQFPGYGLKSGEGL
jgi:hypothetical protein